MNKKQFFLFRFIVVILIILLSYLIVAGSTHTALERKKDIFIFKQNDILPTDPSYYFKGVQDPSKIKMDLSKINRKKTGTYKIPVKQTSRKYEIFIKIIN